VALSRYNSRRCGVAARSGAMLWRCRAAARDAAAALAECFFFFFLNLLLDSFKREKEGEKKRKERDLKHVSRLYWLG